MCRLLRGPHSFITVGQTFLSAEAGGPLSWQTRMSAPPDGLDSWSASLRFSDFQDRRLLVVGHRKRRFSKSPAELHRGFAPHQRISASNVWDTTSPSVLRSNKFRATVPARSVPSLGDAVVQNLLLVRPNNLPPLPLGEGQGVRAAHLPSPFGRGAGGEGQRWRICIHRDSMYQTGSETSRKFWATGGWISHP